MNAVERVIGTCKGRNIPLSHIERACGFANGYLSGLRKGTIPFDRIEKIKKGDHLPLMSLRISSLM